MAVLRPNPGQRRALRHVGSGRYDYDPATASLRAPGNAEPVPRRVVDVLVARGWARWNEVGSRVELTAAGQAAVQQAPRPKPR